jgi:outer membrane autotransporter protein
VIDFTGVTVVDGTGGSEGDFQLAGGRIDKGFVQYELRFDAAASNWNLVGLPSAEPFEALRFGALAQDYWRRSADAWTGRMQDVRDGAPRGEGLEVWAQGHGGGEDTDSHPGFSVGGFDFAPELSTETRWNGVQAGADVVRGGVLWGVTAGYADQNSRFVADGNTAGVKGFNLGGYGSWRSGGLFVSGLVKADWYSLDARFRTAGLNADMNGRTVGVEGEAGYRMSRGAMFFEPVAGASWSWTSLDGFDGAGARAEYGDTNSFQLKLGARAGRTWERNGVRLTPYAGLFAVNEMAGKNRMWLQTGSTGFSVADDPVGGWGKVDLGVNVRTAKGLQGYVAADANLGQQQGVSGRMGVRWRW